jgi:hypothetical protein
MYGSRFQYGKQRLFTFHGHKAKCSRIHRCQTTSQTRVCARQVSELRSKSTIFETVDDIHNKGVYSPEQGAPSLQLLNLLVSPSVYLIPVLETDRYMPVYHTATSFYSQTSHRHLHICFHLFGLHIVVSIYFHFEHCLLPKNVAKCKNVVSKIKSGLHTHTHTHTHKHTNTHTHLAPGPWVSIS